MQRSIVILGKIQAQCVPSSLRVKLSTGQMKVQHIFLDLRKLSHLSVTWTHACVCRCVCVHVSVPGVCTHTNVCACSMCTCVSMCVSVRAHRHSACANLGFAEAREGCQLLCSSPPYPLEAGSLTEPVACTFSSMAKQQALAILQSLPLTALGLQPCKAMPSFLCGPWKPQLRQNSCLCSKYCIH